MYITDYRSNGIIADPGNVYTEHKNKKNLVEQTKQKIV